MPARLPRRVLRRGFPPLRRAGAGCGPARHLARARLTRRCPASSHRVVESRDEAGATELTIRPCAGLRAGFAEFAVQLCQQVGQRVLPLGTGEGVRHVGGHTGRATGGHRAPGGCHLLVWERHRNFHTVSIPSDILSVYRPQVRTSPRFRDGERGSLVHPPRRRVEYCRECTIGVAPRPTADLPPCCAVAPDFLPRRSRRLGTGDAALSGRCSSWGSGFWGSGCGVMRVPLSRRGWSARACPD